MKITDTNQTDMRIKIAEFCGWTNIRQEGGEVLGCIRLTDDHCRLVEPVPDYINDLNAMHEAENTLFDGKTTRRQIRYDVMLFDMCAANSDWHATAAQRAEAFIKTMEDAAQ